MPLDSAYRGLRKQVPPATTDAPETAPAFQDVVEAEGDYQWLDDGGTLKLNFAGGVLGIGHTESRATIHNTTKTLAFRFRLHKLGNLGDWTSTQTEYLLPGESGVLDPTLSGTALSVTDFTTLPAGDVPATHAAPPTPGQDFAAKAVAWMKGTGGLIVGVTVAVLIVAGLAIAYSEVERRRYPPQTIQVAAAPQPDAAQAAAKGAS